jgi:hypothetical protein
MSSAPPTPSTTSPSQTFDTVGGTVTATCQATLAVLTLWTPKPSYMVENVEAGPAMVARVTFHSIGERLVVVSRVTCATGAPVASTTTSNPEP